jgi:hypothetical protein
MTRKLLLGIPMILILHCAVLSLYLLYSGPSPYDFHGISAMWPQLFTLFGAIYLAKELKARYWGVSIIAVALASFPRALIATFPAYINVLVAATLSLDAISAAALLAAFRCDTFDLSLWQERQVSKTSRSWKIIIVLVIIAGIFLYYGMK